MFGQHPVAICILCLVTNAAGAVDTVTMRGLLKAMVDMDALCEYPKPAYTAKRFSSYDRHPASDSVPAWFGDFDHGFFLEDMPAGHVMMDAQGPGVITHIWSAQSNGILHFFFDDSTTASWEMPMSMLLQGIGKIKQPFATTTSRGENCYFPIPYQKSCRIVFTGSPDIYYQIDYRTYDSTTIIQTFDTTVLDSQSALIDSIGDILSNGLSQIVDKQATSRVTSGPIKKGMSTVAVLDGPAKISDISFSVKDMADPSLMRHCLLEITFDDAKHPQVRIPLGDFFGGTPYQQSYQSLPVQISAGQVMTCKWVMPFRKSATIRLINHGSETGSYSAKIVSRPYVWTDRSMYFNARWRQDSAVTTSKNLYWIIYMENPLRDHSMLHITGKGVHVGTIMQIWNRENSWWGEGDDKIWVDDDTFPSFMGTGTEDYFGYAWSTTDPFSHAYHAQPYSDGYSGFTTNARFHISDPQPFERSYKFDMEIQTADRPTSIDYGRAVFFYAFDSATTDHDTLTSQDLYLHPLPVTRVRTLAAATFGSAPISLRYDRNTRALRFSGLPLIGKPGVEISVIRLDGRTVASFHPAGNLGSVDLSRLAPGIYSTVVRVGGVPEVMQTILTGR